MMLFFSSLIIGFLMATFIWNFYYQSEVWAAQKKVKLAKIEAEEAKVRAEKERYEYEITDYLNARIRSDERS